MKLLLALAALLFHLAHAQVLGIDFGTEFWKASLISPGKNLVIVENSRSKRKSKNSIHFDKGIRYYEEDEVQKRVKKPLQSYFELNNLVRSLDYEQPMANFKFENGTYIFEEDENQITLEEMIGMILRNLKKLATLQAGVEIKDCVITVPSNWGFKAKICLVNAAYIADLSVIGLVNENTAAAIHFALDRSDENASNIVLFNMGS